MLDMSQVERIRDMLAHGHTPTEVKTELGVSYPHDQEICCAG